MPASSTSPIDPASRGHSVNPVKRWALKKANTELEMLEDRLVRLRVRFVERGTAFEDRVRILDAQALRLQQLQVRVQAMSTVRRLANSNVEDAEVQAITTCIDEIVTF